MAIAYRLEVSPFGRPPRAEGPPLRRGTPGSRRIGGEPCKKLQARWCARLRRRGSSFATMMSYSVRDDFRALPRHARPRPRRRTRHARRPRAPPGHLRPHRPEPRLATAVRPPRRGRAPDPRRAYPVGAGRVRRSRPRVLRLAVLLPAHARLLRAPGAREGRRSRRPSRHAGTLAERLLRIRLHRRARRLRTRVLRAAAAHRPGPRPHRPAVQVVHRLVRRVPAPDEQVPAPRLLGHGGREGLRGPPAEALRHDRRRRGRAGDLPRVQPRHAGDRRLVPAEHAAVDGAQRRVGAEHSRERPHRAPRPDQGDAGDHPPPGRGDRPAPHPRPGTRRRRAGSARRGVRRDRREPAPVR